MAGREPPYDPYIPSGNGAPAGEYSGHNEGNTRTAALQAQIDDTVHVMKQNINKVQERGENIDTIHQKAGALEENAIIFNRSAGRARRRAVWENNKWRFGLGLLVVLIIALLIGLLVHFFK